MMGDVTTQPVDIAMSAAIVRADIIYRNVGNRLNGGVVMERRDQKAGSVIRKECYWLKYLIK